MSTTTAFPTVPTIPKCITQAQFDFYELGFLVACVVFAGVGLMLIAAVIGIFIKVQNLQQRIELIGSHAKSLRADDDLTKRYAVLAGKGSKLNNSGPNLGQLAIPESSGYQRRNVNENTISCAVRHDDRPNDLYY